MNLDLLSDLFTYWCCNFGCFWCLDCCLVVWSTISNASELDIFVFDDYSRRTFN